MSKTKGTGSPFRPGMALPVKHTTTGWYSKIAGVHFVIVSWSRSPDSRNAVLEKCQGFVYGAESSAHARLIFRGLIQAYPEEIAQEIAGRRAILRCLSALASVTATREMSGHQRLTLTRRYSDALESFAPLLAPERVHRLSHAPYVSLYKSSRGENAAYIELVGRWRGERSSRSFKLRLDGNRQANDNTPAAIAKGLATATPVDLAATLHENHHALLRGLMPYIAGLSRSSRAAAVRRLVLLGAEPLEHLQEESPVAEAA